MTSDALLIETPRGRFAARSIGHPQAPLALCFHGFPDNAGPFDDLRRRLAARHLRAVAVNLRGYAPSTLEGPFDLAALAADVHAIGDALSPGRPYHVIGHDLGALAMYQALPLAAGRFLSAVALAAVHPAALIVNARHSLLQAWRSRHGVYLRIRGLSERTMPRLDFACVERLWRRWSPGFAPRLDHLESVKRTLAASMPAPLEPYRAGFDACDRRPISTSTLTLVGERDHCLSPQLGRGQSAFFTGPFRAETIPAAGHFLHLEQPEIVGGKILQWIEQASARDEASRGSLHRETSPRNGDRGDGLTGLVPAVAARSGVPVGGDK